MGGVNSGKAGRSVPLAVNNQLCANSHRRLARIKRNHYLANTRCIG
jgi:hypothetical protein